MKKFLVTLSVLFSSLSFAQNDEIAEQALITLLTKNPTVKVLNFAEFKTIELVGPWLLARFDVDTSKGILPATHNSCELKIETNTYDCTLQVVSHTIVYTGENVEVVDGDETSLIISYSLNKKLNRIIGTVTAKYKEY